MTPTLEGSKATAQRAIFSILAGISVCHLLNDMIQSLIPAIYPILKASFHLDFLQIGLIGLAYNTTASLLQPLVGLYTDKHPKPFSLPVGMGFSLVGLLVLSVASTYGALMIGAALVGVGSSVFHPESSRVARLASGGQHGLAQSLFQVGGNVGSSVGPLLAAYIVLPRGQGSISWFSIVALAGICLLTWVGAWYRQTISVHAARAVAVSRELQFSSRRVAMAITVLGILVFSKYFYLASLTNYYTFYLIDKFHLSVKDAQILLFVFLGAVAVGTIVGGPVGDRIGRKAVIWGSILGVLPFTLILPHANLFWTVVLTVIIGLILASAFSAILVYAQELVPGRVGMISGLFFGFAFGMGGLGAAVLGKVIDMEGLPFVYNICAFLPAIGLLTAFLPDVEVKK